MADTSPNTLKTDVVGKRLIVSIREFLRDRVSILDNANPESTIEGIEKDIDFKGFNLWILIVAIIMASVGLNANSTAVIIGAMLISPLMGPIMGIGLGIGILDLQMVKRGSRNLGIAVMVAMVTSSLFFLIIPISDVSSELLARTRPDIRDVFIAFFGGLAGILAGSRREKSNVVPGVAIATALMPPLCTAGYGLATLQFSYFIGAAYLFLINAFFIALATVITVRYLRFPKKTYVDATRERKGMRWLGFTVIIMIVPASIIFYNVVKETIAHRQIEQFIANNIETNENAEIVKKEIITTDTANYVNLVMFGQPISAETISDWQNQLNKDAPNSILRIFQGTDKEALPEVEQLVDMFTRSQTEIASREELIKKLENTIEAYEASVLPKSLLKEIQINYPEVAHIKMGRMVYADFNSDTTAATPTFFVYWHPNVNEKELPQRQAQLETWLATRLPNDSVSVFSMGALPVGKIEKQ
jgi:uncharacterized hydrophobic protein (TIGR00271 family)